MVDYGEPGTSVWKLERDDEEKKLTTHPLLVAGHADGIPVAHLSAGVCK